MVRVVPILSRWRHQRRPLAAVALTAVLVLLTAPLRTVVGGCDLCPPDCPMHAAHGAAAAAQHHGAPRMHCHNTPASAEAGATAPRLTRPPCGSHAAITGLELAPMLPTQPLPCLMAPRLARARLDPVSPANRVGDPPDTPPPDARA